MQHIGSRQSLDEATATLVESASSLSDAELTTLGGDLLQVSGVLRREPGLRRTLSESTTGEQARSGLVRQLFGDKIGAAALNVVTVAVGKPWATGADLRDGIERLGRTALFLSAERTDRLGRVEDELFRFGRIIDANPDLSVLLDDPTADPQGRRELVSRLLTGRADELTVDLLADLATVSSGRSFSDGVAELVNQAAERRNAVSAVVQSAVELDSSQHDRLTAALTKLYGKPVAVHVEVVPGLAGGMRITVGDEVIDGSVAGRLAAIRRRLVG